MITTSGSIDVKKVLEKGIATSYSTSNVSLIIEYDSLQKRFNATSIVNSTLTSDGLISFNAIGLWGDGNYSLNIVAESNIDLDTNGVQLNKLGSGCINKITNQIVLNI